MKKFIFMFLFLLSTIVQADGNTKYSENRIVGIVNNSSEIIVAIYGSNIGRGNWEENILNGQVYW